ncbi:unnamed protein product [Amoebophrya sp. A25]|nr:unnamed protein product [Amoebophrya sp. A25]|eukprot:GSA25T00018246001.1
MRSRPTFFTKKKSDMVRVRHGGPPTLLADKPATTSSLKAPQQQQAQKAPAQGKPKNLTTQLATLLLHGANPNLYSHEDAGERRPLLYLAIEEACNSGDWSTVELLLEQPTLNPGLRCERQPRESSFELVLRTDFPRIAASSTLDHESTRQKNSPTSQGDSRQVYLVRRMLQLRPSLVHETSGHWVKDPSSSVSAEDDQSQEGSPASETRANLPSGSSTKTKLEQKPDKKISPLHRAVFSGHDEVALVLLLHGANVNATDCFGQTPLFFSLTKPVTKLLLNHHADPAHVSTRGQVAAHVLASNGCAGALSILLEHFPEAVNVQDSEGRTPLHLAAARGEEGALAVLLDNGADMQIKTKRGKMTAISYAERHGKDDAAFYLYMRWTGSKHASWNERLRNPLFLFTLVIVVVSVYMHAGTFQSAWNDYWEGPAGVHPNLWVPKPKR